ncbi:MAG: PaaI family thioesterase [Spirochaetaceae bacterium]|nr:PaaI family thioesterase [Spirochaetaceae bacterium]
MENDDRSNDKAAFDSEAFFRSGNFGSSHPDLRIPPPSFRESGATIVAHEPNESLTVKFSVREGQTNPVGFLQGGILCSFFDDSFGPLAFATLKKPCLSIDMNITFVRATKPGDCLTIVARIISKTRKLLQMSAEARNERGKLVATATSNLLVYEP